MSEAFSPSPLGFTPDDNFSEYDNYSGSRMLTGPATNTGYRDSTRFTDSVQFSGSPASSRSRLSNAYRDNYQNQEAAFSHQGKPPIRLRPSSMEDSPSLAELLVYPAVEKIFNDLTEANRRVARALDSQDTLQKEILRMSIEIREANAGRYMSSR